MMDAWSGFEVGRSVAGREGVAAATARQGARRASVSQASTGSVRVINLLSHGPAYELLSEHKRLLRKWTLPGGETVGIVNREWPGELGRWVLAQADQYRWEVWQPDVRVDRVYSHIFDDGVIHHLLPAERRIVRPGLLRASRDVYSGAILDRLEDAGREPTILLLHGAGMAFWYDVLRRIGGRQRYPIFLVGHGNYIAPIQRLTTSRHPLSFPACVIEQARARQLYRYLDGFSEQDRASLAAARSVFAGRIDRLTMGCDFELWRPVPDRSTKDRIRADLGLSTRGTVFLAVAAFGGRKQLDRLLAAFARLAGGQDFTLVLVGQGDPTYTRRLHELAATMVKDGRVIFHPYAVGQALRNLYWAADVFVSSSGSEGGPVTVMEAMACSLPVLTTPVGRTFEVMREHGVDVVLPLEEWERWPAIVQSLLDGRLPRPLDRDIARAEFDWWAVAAKLVDRLADLEARGRRHRVEALCP